MRGYERYVRACAHTHARMKTQRRHHITRQDLKKARLPKTGLKIVSFRLMKFDQYTRREVRNKTHEYRCRKSEIGLYANSRGEFDELRQNNFAGLQVHS
ncbi:hypothetical protein EVAR_17164_1 [Eumeta japonica]|uniref:Uncharacterized protein n=1 Tax=Eumeta variegata TaxID=151549 RepID=A0A4C1U9N8_EUMVA|nr:hypothetical protein EVAR_17164_1 [Eumeta japonica]